MTPVMEGETNAQQMHSLGLQNYGLCRQTLSTFPPCVSSGPDQSWAVTAYDGLCFDFIKGWQVLLGPAPGVVGIAAAHLLMDLEISLQPSPLNLQPEGFGDFQVLRVEDRADELFHGVFIVQELW